MKKLLSLILSLALLLSLTACGGGNGGNGGGSANSPITSVVHPEFELTNGFILRNSFSHIKTSFLLICVSLLSTFCCQSL